MTASDEEEEEEKEREGERETEEEELPTATGCAPQWPGPQRPTAQLWLTVPCAQESLLDIPTLVSKAFLHFKLPTALTRKTLSSQRTPAHFFWCPFSGFPGQPPLPTQPRGSWAPAFLPPQPRRTLPSVLGLCFPSVLFSGRGPSLALLAVSFTFCASDALTSGTVLTLEGLPLPGPPLPSLE